MEVQLVDKPRKVGKEMADVAEGLKEIILDVRSGKKMDALTENIGNIMDMIQGWEMLDDEAKHDSKVASIAYVMEKLAEGFMDDVVKVAE